MLNIYNNLLSWGIEHATSKNEKRAVALCNRLSIFLACIPILYIFLVWLTYGVDRFKWPLLIQPLILLTPLLFNRIGLITLSRILLSWLMPLLIITYSILNKSSGIDLETSSYVGFRITMIACTIVPFLIFSLHQKSYMAIALTIPLFSILGFDFLHTLFGVGYSQVGLSEISYPLTNIRSVSAILIIGAVSLTLKQLVEESEKQNELLLHEVNKSNLDITDKLEKIKLQNREIALQSQQIQAQNKLLEERYQEILVNYYKLSESRKELEQANHVIENQKAILDNQNKQLEHELLVRNKELEKSNCELIYYNNNLTQYSFMVSHNLRGPVSSLMGLMSILPKERLDEELAFIYEKAFDSIQRLNSVINDINSIIETQNSLKNTEEKIYWDQAVDKVSQLLQTEISEHHPIIKTNFEIAPYLIGIKTFIESILYNLISNAIKYRSPDRPLQIEIKTHIENQYITLTVTDNGSGINLEEQKHNLFKIYKRFHTNVDGRGLGLYMVKMQTELMNGTIDVASEVDRHTTFTLRFPVKSLS